MGSCSINSRGETQSTQKYFEDVGLTGRFLSNIQRLPRQDIRVVVKQQPAFFENQLEL